jgi:hypothetical protein
MQADELDRYTHLRAFVIASTRTRGAGERLVRRSKRVPRRSMRTRWNELWTSFPRYSRSEQTQRDGAAHSIWQDQGKGTFVLRPGRGDEEGDRKPGRHGTAQSQHSYVAHKHPGPAKLGKEMGVWFLAHKLRVLVWYWGQPSHEGQP